jgi:hypothetical protein
MRAQHNANNAANNAAYMPNSASGGTAASLFMPMRGSENLAILRGGNAAQGAMEGYHR